MMMPSHMSSLGFDIKSKEEFVGLAMKAKRNGSVLKCRSGTYRRWSVDEHVELYAQVDEKGKGIGLNPHFCGKSRQVVELTQYHNKKKGTRLDGSFICHVVSKGAHQVGSFPYIFDCPDAKMHEDIVIPQQVEIQLSAIAHELNIFKDEEDFLAFQDSEWKMATESFIPSGMFGGGKRKKQMDAMVIMSGKVVSMKSMTNGYTGLGYVYIILEVQGYHFDVVVDERMVNKEISIGYIISGLFWLSGKMTCEYERRQRGLLKFLLRGHK